MISASQLNTYLFCPRLLFLEAVMGYESSNIQSEEGRLLHDKLASEEVYVENTELGLCGRVDVYTEEGIPIEYKRGVPRPGNIPWEGHQIQLCAMGLLLEHVENRPIEYGYIWYNNSRQRIRVDFIPSLREMTLAVVQEAQDILKETKLPAPITNRKACLGCNQYRNCLPDELSGTNPPEESKKVLAQHIEGQGLYVDKAGCKLSIKEGHLLISHYDEPSPTRIGLGRLNQVIVQQPANCTSSFLEACADNKIPVMFLTRSGKWMGSLTYATGRNSLVRLKQYELFHNMEERLAYSKILVASKLQNQRVFLRRHLGKDHDSLNVLVRNLESIQHASSLEQLMGFEGESARAYFSGLSERLVDNDDFAWLGRKKHPSPDPINALLSFGYSLLLQQLITSCQLVGLDPHVGFYHGLKHGKPALALDLMEIYRTPIVDSTVFAFINRNQCDEDDFEIKGSACFLKERARKAFVKAIFERFSEEIKHPIFDYQCTLQRAMHVEGRLFSYALLSGIELWKPFTWR